jgi:hypothetical protein
LLKLSDSTDLTGSRLQLLKELYYENRLDVCNYVMEIELELRSASRDVREVLDKVSQLVKKSKELGFEIDSLEIESEEEKEE